MRLELTRRGDYAIRAMLALADDHGVEWLSVPRVSASMAIPERFLPRVMADLVDAGLVVGRRGRTGGYRLARPAAAISLLDIIAAAEPEPDARTCILRGGPCGLDGRCVVHDAFSGAREAMLDRLGQTTLAEVVRTGLP
jgi:Rrf2 family iron-sulfur cluster assembly transcriptional regulator